jgi:L-lactate permease
VFVLVLAVPALLVVVLGYAVGYAVWAELAGPDGAEVAGWLAGLALLAISVRVALALWRARRRR